MQGLKIFLILIWEEDENDYSYLINLIKSLIMLYEGDPHNKKNQRATYDFFISNINTEIFFSKIYELIRLVTSMNKQNKKINKTLHKLLLHILRLFQLFCEGHFNEMQIYISNQKNSKNSFDLVQAIANLSSSFLISEENFKIIVQCFDTISEFIQVCFFFALSKFY